jgi:PHD/YefM family antitoxin component YafN of YafNO toxin-antitoxin module
MTASAISKALKNRKPAIIKERGTPRFVILDWETYKKWEEEKDDLEDSKRLLEALKDPKNKKKIKFSA